MNGERESGAGETLSGFDDDSRIAQSSITLESWRVTLIADLWNPQRRMCSGLLVFFAGPFQSTILVV